MSNEVEQRVLTMTDKRNLEKELEELRQAKLDVAEEIKVARGHGDLSENAEYDEAKNNEARIYGRLAEVENTLKTAVFVDDSKLSTDTVAIGHAVKVYDMEFDEEDTYTLVGFTEADPAKLFISGESPIGKAGVDAGLVVLGLVVLGVLAEVAVAAGDLDLFGHVQLFLAELFQLLFQIALVGHRQHALLDFVGHVKTLPVFIVAKNSRNDTGALPQCLFQSILLYSARKRLSSPGFAPAQQAAVGVVGRGRSLALSRPGRTKRAGRGALALACPPLPQKRSSCLFP